MTTKTGPEEQNESDKAAAANAEHDPATQDWLRKTEAILTANAEITIHKEIMAEQLLALKQAALQGDKVALAKIYETASLAILALEQLRIAQPTLVTEFAAQKFTWPVGYVAHQHLQNVQTAYENLVKDLKLGSKFDSVIDPEATFKKWIGQDIVREFVVVTLKRIESIRRINREYVRLGWYNALLSGQSHFSAIVAMDGDPIAKRRVQLALKLPPLEKKGASSDQWILAIKELLMLECDGFPEKDPRFRACGESRARSKATSRKSGMMNAGEIRDKSFAANIKDAIFKR